LRHSLELTAAASQPQHADEGSALLDGQQRSGGDQRRKLRVGKLGQRRHRQPPSLEACLYLPLLDGFPYA
jgi:hypothetical protein